MIAKKRLGMKKAAATPKRGEEGAPLSRSPLNRPKK